MHVVEIARLTNLCLTLSFFLGSFDKAGKFVAGIYIGFEFLLQES